MVFQISDCVVGIGRVSFHRRPAVGQAVVGIVLIHKNRVARRVHLVRLPPKRIVIPRRRLVLGRPSASTNRPRR